MADPTPARLKKDLDAAKAKFGKPVTADEVKKAEKRLGVALPASYVKFVTTYGAFTVGGELTGRGEGNDTVLFTPAQAAKETLAYRAKLAKSRDEDSKEILNDGILYCADPEGERFYVFVVSSARGKSEMKTRYYDYQDPANTDPWFIGDGTFASSIAEIIERVRDNADES